jgi:benzil reductase ((S)-benzoin forming)
MRVLITGHSSGLGKSLANKFISESHEVYGISRSTNPDVQEELICDFSKPHDLQKQISKFFQSLEKVDYVFLNAGILGKIEKVKNNTVDSLLNTININFISNKIIIDCLYKTEKMPKHAIIGISSGAALKPKYGWSEYCISKSCFKMLFESYAVEDDSNYFYSLAPGVIKTRMQNQIKNVNHKNIPSVKKFHDMYDTMDGPDKVAQKIYDFLPSLESFKSGDYIDIRNF